MASRERIGLILLLLLTAGLFFVNLGGYDLWPPDEPRFAEIAREMYQSGDPIVLHVNNEFYKEKPPLLFWSIVAASFPVGEVTALTARIPSALAGLFTVLLTFLLARRLFDGRTALWAGLILATTGLFWWEARSVRTDMLLTACCTAALYSFWRYHESPRFRWLAALYLAMAAALFAKGPPALVFTALTIAVFYWGRREPRKRLHLLLGILIAAVPVVAWFLIASHRGAPAAPTTEEATAGANLFRQTIGRFFMGVSKAQYPWYFIQTLPLYLLPWTLFLPWTLLYAWRHRRDGEAMRFLLSWIVPAFLFFSISIGKRAVYLLPAYPAFAILFARSILDLMDGDRVRWRRITATVGGVGLLLLAAAPYAILFTPYREAWNNGFFILMGVAFICGLDLLRRAAFTEARALHLAVAMQFSVVALLGAVVAMPAMNVHKSASTLTEPLRTLSRSGAEYRLYSVGFSREEYIFYAEHFHTEVLTDLLTLDLPVKLDLPAMAKLQRRLKKDMIAAVAEVPIADLMHITDPEAAALRTAADKAIAASKVEPIAAQAFERSLTKTVEGFATEFGAGGPAYFFVEDADWRWLVALYPHLRDYPVLRFQSVGSREVLLIANAAGGALPTGKNSTGLQDSNG